jgi:hypothetical protein
MATGRFHPVRRVRPPFGRAFQSNPAGPVRQPLGARFFPELRRIAARLTHSSYTTWTGTVKGGFKRFAATRRHVTVPTTALKDISPHNPRQGLVTFSCAGVLCGAPMIHGRDAGVNPW